jgi:hypothetical protein
MMDMDEKRPTKTRANLKRTFERQKTQKTKAPPKSALKKVQAVGLRHTCPLGCKVMANDDMVIRNLVDNGMLLSTICQQRYNY